MRQVENHLGASILKPALAFMDSLKAYFSQLLASQCACLGRIDEDPIACVYTLCAWQPTSSQSCSGSREW